MYWPTIKTSKIFVIFLTYIFFFVVKFAGSHNTRRSCGEGCDNFMGDTTNETPKCGHILGSRVQTQAQGPLYNHLLQILQLQFWLHPPCHCQKFEGLSNIHICLLFISISVLNCCIGNG